MHNSTPFRMFWLGLGDGVFFKTIFTGKSSYASYFEFNCCPCTSDSQRSKRQECNCVCNSCYTWWKSRKWYLFRISSFPFEKEDPLEIGKNKVINAVKQKTESTSKTINSPLEMPFRMIKANSKGEEINLRLTNRFFLFKNWLKRTGKMPNNFALPSLVNRSLPWWVGKQICWSNLWNSKKKKGDPKNGYPFFNN